MTCPSLLAGLEADRPARRRSLRRPPGGGCEDRRGVQLRHEAAANPGAAGVQRLVRCAGGIGGGEVLSFLFCRVCNVLLDGV